MLQNRVFFALAPRSGFGAAISHAVAHSSIVFCNSTSRYRIVILILISFAAGHRKSYWGGCTKAAIVICQKIFSVLALVIVLLKFLLKSASKSCFFLALAPGSGFGAAISVVIMQHKVSLCKNFIV